jgi:hypothetical protein
MLTITVASCCHQGQPAFSATWSQGQAISHTAAAATALAAYCIAAARRQVCSARAITWGSFRQRTIDRRYCGALAAGHPYSAGCSYPQAVQLAGGVPSSRCWVPGHV